VPEHAPIDISKAECNQLDQDLQNYLENGDRYSQNFEQIEHSYESGKAPSFFVEEKQT
jgi:hypothetical protein